MGGFRVSWATFRKILVPLDGSKLAERALDPALRIAFQQGSEVTLLRAPVIEGMAVPMAEPLGGVGLFWPEGAEQTAVHEARKYLENVKKRYRGRGVPLSMRLAEGDAAEVILATARARNFDLVAMSSHGYSGLTRLVLGSVTEQVLHGIGCPVLVIRSQDPVRHILIALDRSATSEQALEPGLETARALGARVTLLHACEPKDPVDREAQGHGPIEHGVGSTLQESGPLEVQDYLSEMARRYSDSGVQVETALTSLPVADKILDYAQAHDVDMIAMGTHGRTGFQKLVHGSITERVLHAGCCSMLIVPPRG